MKYLAWLWLLAAALATADERILDFGSDVVIHADGWIEVTETITVRAEGHRIRRGIYRDFPTRYRDVYGNVHEVAYRPLAVLRNDAPEDFHSERLGNGVRTYFGNADRLLEPGVHRYRFRYRANRVLGFFENHDELYWNATGLEWEFPIDQARASVRFAFADAPDILAAEAFTGPMGARGRAYRQRIEGSRVHFETTALLVPHEGMTIVVTWPKGYVDAPAAVQRAVWLLEDNVNLLIALAGLAGMLAYFVPVWRAFGRDPEPGLVVTRYEPPDGFSPASLRFIQEMRYDNKVMTAAVVNLAVKGYLRIDESDGDYTLARTAGEGGAPLAAGERELLDAIFDGGPELVLDDRYHERIGGARSAHRRSLSRDYRGRYFKTNGIMNLPPVFIGATTGVIALTYGYGPTPAVVAAIVGMALVYLAFAAIMKRPTPVGRKLLDELAGFREYLDVAEKDEMNLRNPPKKTPALFERYLPYALAMGVEQHWAERFATVLAETEVPGAPAYRPTWYSGSWDSFDARAAADGLSGSLNSAISSSATPPGSSSGSGGGSSGGGGGGGGGGGW